MAGITPESMHLAPSLVRLKCRHDYYLRVTEDGVEGTKDGNDDYTILEMINSTGQEGTVIRGKTTNRYVGMNSEGNLLTYNSLIEDCVFKEQQTERNGYISFESRPHVSWYLALTKDGRAKPGPKTSSGQRAVAFAITGIHGQNTEKH